MQFPQSQCCNNSYLPPYNGSYSGCGNQYPIVPGGNPALQTWNGQAFVVADGSAQNPISLPFLKTTQGGAAYFLGADNNGNWSYYNPTNVTNANNLEVTATGSTTARTLANRSADVVNVKDFGAKGDGVTDDTAAIQAAIDKAFSIGGAIVDCSGGRWLIDSANLNVKRGVTLSGPWLNIGSRKQLDYYTIDGVFIVNPTYTINIFEYGAGVKGLCIYRKGLSKPTDAAGGAAEVANFAGKGITLATQVAEDCYIGHCLVLGFQYGIYSDFNARLRIEYVSGDCTNGIYIKRCYDMAHISHCHFYPFVTTYASWYLANANVYSRTGNAYTFDSPNDWGQADNCFSWGYNCGFRIINSDHVELLNCGADHHASGGDTTTFGFLIEGTSQSAKLIGCKAAAQGSGLGLNITSSNQVSLIGSDFWGNLSADVNVVSGSLIATGNIFSSNATFANVYLSGNGLFTLTNNSFLGAATPISATTSAKAGLQNYLNQFLNADSTIGQNKLFSNQLMLETTSAYITSPSNIASHNVVVKRSAGSQQTPIAVGNNTNSVTYSGQVYDGSGFGTVASISLGLRGAVSVGSTAGGINFSTTSLGSNSATLRHVITESGALVPVTDNAYTLGASGLRWSSVWAANGTIQTSDERTKKDIADSPLGLDFIEDLRPVSYRFKVGSNKVIRQVYRDTEGNEVDSNAEGANPAEIITEEVAGERVHYGLLAQEVKAALPEGTDFGGWILTDKNDPNSEQGLRYEEFISPLIKAVQELSEQNKTLVARIESLEAAN